ncbi:hypothetical protein KR222_008200, partial [Zaprionus bogoriensis]
YAENADAIHIWPFRSLTRHKITQYRLATKETRVICTKYGRLRGLQRKTLYDEEPYFAFEGVPFAKPPLGELRFRAPQPAEPWTGVKDCTYARAKPMQKHCALGLAEGSEDCLHINVYVKNLNFKKPLPVMVWIYGGGFQLGEATRDIHGPDYFMKKNIVLAIPNYRIGAFGFLSMSDPDLDVPGNAGIKDTVLALQWIQENISNFNGDPKNVTIIGLSSGAAVIQILMATENARGLFHRAIIMSGSTLCGWATVRHNNWAYQMANHLGFKGSKTEKEIFHFLQRAPAKELIHYFQAANTMDISDLNVLPFGPVVEPYISPSCVVPKPHVEMLSQAWGNSIPVIIGGTSFEGLFYYQLVQKSAKQVLHDFSIIIPREVRKVSSPAEIEEYIRRIKLSFFEDANCDRLELKEFLRLMCVPFFWQAFHRTILARQTYAPSVPTYLYRFDFDSPTYNFFRNTICGRDETGVTHADDLFYMFNSIISYKLDKSSPEYQTIERLIGMWTAFATNENPNCPEIAAVTWEPLVPNTTPMCINISRDIQIIELPEIKMLKLWHSFYEKVKLF